MAKLAPFNKNALVPAVRRLVLSLMSTLTAASERSPEAYCLNVTTPVVPSISTNAVTIFGAARVLHSPSDAALLPMGARYSVESGGI